MAPTGFIIKQPGIHSLLQDAGRFGAFNIGLTNGGPIDTHAFYWANRLCKNKLDGTNIEVSIGGLSVIAQVDSVIAVTGATMPLTINNEAKDLWRSHKVKAGDIIKLGYATKGIRCYLAVSGGFQIKEQFGSTATVCREHIGGLAGSKLVQGDFLACNMIKDTEKHKTNLVLPEKSRPSYTPEVILHTIPSYQQRYFSSHQQRLFFSSEYTVSKHNDRMGYRLEGNTIACDTDGILSEGICHGAVQIPADGQPIVLMNDRQTIGGYPKIGSVISSDTAKLSQLSQGAKVYFEPISMDKAHNLYHLALNRFNRTALMTCD